MLVVDAAGYAPAQPDEEGWVTSAVLGTQLRREVGEAGPKLHLRRADDPARALTID
ncbi:MAG: hypothetical protein AB7N76_14925 [Planctomycetota bacterium]